MKNNFTVFFFIFLIVQIVICNYFNLSMYITISILPVLIFLMPIRINTTLTMIIAFVSGLIVDWLAEGLIGINAFALVPVAGVKTLLYKIFFGEEIVEREGYITAHKYGWGKIIISIITCQIIFFIFYITIDGGLIRPFTFSLIRFILSVIFSTLISLIIFEIIQPNERR